MFCAALSLGLGLLCAAAAADGVSETRVAYVLGRPFRNAHDSYSACVPRTTDYVRSPLVGGHEAISVGVSCEDSVRLSSVMAGISWISTHGEVDATVIVPREYREADPLFPLRA